MRRRRSCMMVRTEPLLYNESSPSSDSNIARLTGEVGGISFSQHSKIRSNMDRERISRIESRQKISNKTLGHNTREESLRILGKFCTIVREMNIEPMSRLQWFGGLKVIMPGSNVSTKSPWVFPFSTSTGLQLQYLQIHFHSFENDEAGFKVLIQFKRHPRKPLVDAEARLV